MLTIRICQIGALAGVNPWWRWILGSGDINTVAESPVFRDRSKCIESAEVFVAMDLTQVEIRK